MTFVASVCLDVADGDSGLPGVRDLAKLLDSVPVVFGECVGEELGLSGARATSERRARSCLIRVHLKAGVDELD